MNFAQITTLFELSKIIYRSILRPLVLESVNDSISTNDDAILSFCDLLFDYGSDQQQAKIVYELMQKLYAENLRALLVAAVSKTVVEIDDYLVQICDSAFKYNKIEQA